MVPCGPHVACPAAYENNHDSTKSHTEYRLLKFPRMVEVEELASSKSEHHALIVFLELVVHLSSYQSSKFALWK